jgi:hypothetical protein
MSARPRNPGRIPPCPIEAQSRTPIVQNQDHIVQLERFDERLEIASVILDAIGDVGFVGVPEPDEIGSEATHVSARCAESRSSKDRRTWDCRAGVVQWAPQLRPRLHPHRPSLSLELPHTSWNAKSSICLSERGDHTDAPNSMPSGVSCFCRACRTASPTLLPRNAWPSQCPDQWPIFKAGSVASSRRVIWGCRTCP